MTAADRQTKTKTPKTTQKSAAQWRSGLMVAVCGLRAAPVRDDESSRSWGGREKDGGIHPHWRKRRESGNGRGGGGEDGVSPSGKPRTCATWSGGDGSETAGSPTTSEAPTGRSGTDRVEAVVDVGRPGTIGETSHRPNRPTARRSPSRLHRHRAIAPAPHPSPSQASPPLGLVAAEPVGERAEEEVNEVPGGARPVRQR
jgi:hypothetical protein